MRKLADEYDEPEGAFHRRKLAKALRQAADEIERLASVAKAAEGVVAVFRDRQAAAAGLKANERHWLDETANALAAL